MVSFHQAMNTGDIEQVRRLFTEYMTWVHMRLNEDYDLDFDVQDKIAQDMTELDMFSPPDGRIILVTIESRLVGIGCLRKIGEEIGEIKRMFIRSQFRGRGIGRNLLEYLVQEAKLIGYTSLRLDSTRFMRAAHNLYRSYNFREIEPYPGSEIPKEVQEHWVYMEKELF